MGSLALLHEQLGLDTRYISKLTLELRLEIKPEITCGLVTYLL